MSADWIVPLLLAFIAAVPGWYAAFVRTPKRDIEELRKLRAESQKIAEDTETMRYERAEKLSAKLEIMEARIHQIECENALLVKEVEELKDMNNKLIRENGDLRQWAERLIEQVKSANIEPVILDRKKRST